VCFLRNESQVKFYEV